MFKAGVKSLFAACTSWLLGPDDYEDCEVKKKQIEDYPAGYPRFSAIVAAHNSFQICRRFSVLRSRLLLLKQDKLSMLEQQLENIDDNERRKLFLGSSREDKNTERGAVLAEIDKALAEYDDFVERNRRMLNARIAKPRDIRSLQHWVNGNGCLSWEESEYLQHCDDLCNIVPSEDDATVRFKAWIEETLGRFLVKFQDRSRSNLSKDPHVFILPLFITRVARALIVLLIVVLLLVPIIVCQSLSSSSARLAVITVSLITFLVILSAIVTRKTNELFVAGATYTTVLVVFISGTNLGA